jgi:ABC-type dipeptide/oligopeptide/nickel transport system permease subunit
MCLSFLQRVRSATALAVNLVSDSLRDALDPRMARQR